LVFPLVKVDRMGFVGFVFDGVGCWMLLLWLSLLLKGEPASGSWA